MSLLENVHVNGILVVYSSDLSNPTTICYLGDSQYERVESLSTQPTLPAMLS